MLIGAYAVSISVPLSSSVAVIICFQRSRGFTSRAESVTALQISHSVVSIKTNNPSTSTANSFVIQSLLGCLPVSSFQTPPQRQGQSADWLVCSPRCGGTITMSLTGSRASLSCSTAFIHVNHNVHNGPYETLWPYEPCQLIAPLDISTLPVPGALKDSGLGRFIAQMAPLGFVKGTGASCNVGQCTFLRNPSFKWLLRFTGSWHHLFSIIFIVWSENNQACTSTQVNSVYLCWFVLT